MKSLISILILWLSISALAQQTVWQDPKPEDENQFQQYEDTSFVYRFNLYEEQKKDAFVAGLASLVIPGLGQVYNDQYLGGLLVFGGYAGSVAYILSQENAALEWWIAPGFIHLIATIQAIFYTSDYNKKLRIKYGLTPNQFRAQISLNF